MPNHKSHAMTSSKFSKEEVFSGQRYRSMEDQKAWSAALPKLKSENVKIGRRIEKLV